jgi:hypothetical protein
MPATLNAPYAVRSGTMLGEVLAAIHEEWIANAERAIAPALLGTSTIWDRWSAVPYLMDAFAEQLEQERELVRRLPRIDPEARDRIERGFETMERLRAELDLAGRRHHTGGLVMLLLRKLMDVFTHWCATIERAAARVPLASLPADVVERLDRLDGSPARLGA